MIALLLSLSAASAQVAIEHQPDPAAWYDEADGLLVAKRVPVGSLPTLPAGKVDATLAADLAKYDWLEAGSYSFADKAATAGYDDATPCQVNLRRYQPDGGELRFEYVAPCATVKAGKIEHLNFHDPPTSAVSVTSVGGVTYLKSVAWGETSLSRVVSYADGVLVVDESKDGKPGSKPAIRVVYVAMPERFTWKFGE